MYTLGYPITIQYILRTISRTQYVIVHAAESFKRIRLRVSKRTGSSNACGI